ncbi:hypothetical protein SAMD00019534_034320 [Acytostelium subglobosum LB1]|uniref:hypothetical protein n=1 Tax=Acytostelium subglobosum LB1 TaxID=1410327 RepID=UPI0006450581|nr:hypothetical protein SAMD00019534_034320 [Acytostelium subglobosum LB1]GAM20257.1 hypothetical protein SAMD00019534_034320 [Acytostelium subglobosum LB1]|eukprot:XP_012759778.1 hypothetical protein SAMD00019534_034320 [Acytostelium subglobosum LB1]
MTTIIPNIRQEHFTGGSKCKGSSEFVKLLNMRLKDTPLLKQTSKPLLWVDIDDSVLKAFEVICSQKVLSIPVFSTLENKWVSMLDVKDLCAHIVSLFDPKNQMRTPVPDGYTVRNLLTSNEPGEDLIRNCPIVTQDCTVLELLNIFNKKIHRICVSNGPSPMDIKIISEMSLIKWIDQNREKMGPIFEKTLEEYKLYDPEKKIISIPNIKLAIDAFRKLKDNNIYGMPIVSETDDELVDSISVIDIRNARLDLARLKQPLSEYFNPSTGKGTSIQRTPIICTPHTRIREAIGKIASTKVHRIFIIEGLVDGRMNNKPLSVVSVSDIVRVILTRANEEMGVVGVGSQ